MIESYINELWILVEIGDERRRRVFFFLSFSSADPNLKSILRSIVSQSGWLLNSYSFFFKYLWRNIWHCLIKIHPGWITWLVGWLCMHAKGFNKFLLCVFRNYFFGHSDDRIEGCLGYRVGDLRQFGVLPHQVLGRRAAHLPRIGAAVRLLLRLRLLLRPGRRPATSARIGRSTRIPRTLDLGRVSGGGSGSGGRRRRSRQSPAQPGVSQRRIGRHPRRRIPFETPSDKVEEERIVASL